MGLGFGFGFGSARISMRILLSMIPICTAPRTGLKAELQGAESSGRDARSPPSPSPPRAWLGLG